MVDWSSDEARQAIRAFMEGRDLNVLSWTKAAKIPESTLRNFLNGGPAKTITLKSLEKLAWAANVDVAVLLGLAPEMTKDQLRAAEIAGCLSPDDLNVWLHWGAKNLPPPVDQGQPPAVAERRRR